MNAALGLASIGTRSDARYAFSGPGLVEIRITGQGRIFGMEWIAAQDEQKLRYEPYAIMNLPHPGGPRYMSIQGAKAIAGARVDLQAPKRRPLQETTNAPAPSAAPLAGVPFERARVGSLTPDLGDDLDSLITDLSEDPVRTES